MRGLVRGELSQGSTPLLQLYCRSYQLLADMVAGTYLIEDLSTGSAVTVVPSANFNTALVSSGGHKLGTGRYVIPTGATTAWNLGTHRAVCRFQMTVGGPMHTEVQLFEILDPLQFVAGQEYIGYTSTRRILTDAAIDVTNVGLLQVAIAEASALVEQWTGNWFEPRYVVLKLDGRPTRALFLDVPVVALEKIESVAKDVTGLETRYDWNSAYWRAYNRHLDGEAVTDQGNPRVELISRDVALATADWSIFDWNWPFGQQNIELTGVFGCLDSAPSRSVPGAALGVTPRELHRVISAVASRILSDPTLTDITAQNAGRVKLYATSKQRIEFHGGFTTGSRYGTMSGDDTIDQLLVRLRKPIRAEYVGEPRASWSKIT